MKSPWNIIREYMEWKDRWEELCSCCGKCCYTRTPSYTENMEIDLAKPCEFLNTSTKKCTIYEYRFDGCDYCAKVNLFRAIFSPYLPSTCAYVKKFR